MVSKIKFIHDVATAPSWSHIEFTLVTWLHWMSWFCWALQTKNEESGDLEHLKPRTGAFCYDLTQTIDKEHSVFYKLHLFSLAYGELNFGQILSFLELNL